MQATEKTKETRASRKSEALEAKGLSRHAVRKRVQEMILDGEIKPGAKLVQMDLAGKFGVSQAVIREALLELASLGLTESIDNRGMYVKPLGRDTLLESFDVREAHEGMAVRLCCEHATRAQLRELVPLIDHCYESGQKQAWNEAGMADREFHDRLTQLSGNATLIRLSEHYRLLRKLLFLKRDPLEIKEEHLAILSAIEDGRADDAEKLMRAHIHNGKMSLDQQITSGDFKAGFLE